MCASLDWAMSANWMMLHAIHLVTVQCGLEPKTNQQANLDGDDKLTFEEFKIAMKGACSVLYFK